MTFEDWFYEQQNFSLRAEWFWEDVQGYQGDNPEVLLKWLKAAYEEGYNQARYDTMKLYWDDGK